jgi:hypothetical protein
MLGLTGAVRVPSDLAFFIIGPAAAEGGEGRGWGRRGCCCYRLRGVCRGDRKFHACWIWGLTRAGASALGCTPALHVDSLPSAHQHYHQHYHQHAAGPQVRGEERQEKAGKPWDCWAGRD